MRPLLSGVSAKATITVFITLCEFNQPHGRGYLMSVIVEGVGN